MGRTCEYNTSRVVQDFQIFISKNSLSFKLDYFDRFLIILVARLRWIPLDFFGFRVTLLNLL